MSIAGAINFVRCHLFPWKTAAESESKRCRVLPGEDERTFMKRCMHRELKEKGLDQDQAVAICLSTWRRGTGTKRKAK